MYRTSFTLQGAVVQRIKQRNEKRKIKSQGKTCFYNYVSIFNITTSHDNITLH